MVIKGSKISRVIKSELHYPQRLLPFKIRPIPFYKMEITRKIILQNTVG